MSQNRNVTITIQDHRGLATLVGFVVVLILSRLWWTGMLTELFTAACTPSDGALTSVSYTIVAFIANLVYGVGTVIVLAWSGLWWLLLDILDGFRQWTRERQAKRELADAVAVEEVTSSDATGGVGDTGILGVLKAIDANVRTTHTQLQELAGRIKGIDSRVTAVEEAAAKPRTTRAKAAR